MFKLGEKECKPLTWLDGFIHDSTTGKVTTWDESITGSIVGLDEFAETTGLTLEDERDEHREQVVKECKRLVRIALRTKNRRIRKKLIKRIESLFPVE